MWASVNSNVKTALRKLICKKNGGRYKIIKMTTNTEESCLIEKLNGDFLSSTGSKEEMRDF